MKKVIVVGAGVAGMASALRLQAAGYEVTIFEKNASPGGRMNQIDMDGFKFDLAPTILMMPHIYREVFSDCGVNPDDYLRMRRLDPIYSVYFADGTAHRASSELTELSRSLEEVGFGETKGYLNYLSDVYGRYLVAKDHFINRSFRRPADFYNPRTLMAALRLRTFDDAYSSVGKFVKDKKLRELLSFQTLYIGVSPFNGPSIYTIIPMIELIYGVWFLEGGMYSMVRGMERLFRERGGRMYLNAPVDRVWLEDGRARGVTVNGEHVLADFVLCTADFPYALDKLLPKGFRQGKYRAEKIRKFEYSCSCYMMYLGLDTANFPGLNVHNLAFSSDFEKNLSDIFDGRFPEDPSLYVYVPALADPSLAPEGKLGLYVLVPVPNLVGDGIRWNDPTVAARVRRTSLDRVERIAPLKGFQSHIVAEKVFTPLDFEGEFNAMFGATFGLKPTLMQSNYFRPQPKAANVEGLYFAGASNHPGAGVPIVLTSAKLAAQELMKDDE